MSSPLTSPIQEKADRARLTGPYCGCDWNCSNRATEKSRGVPIWLRKRFPIILARRMDQNSVDPPELFHLRSQLLWWKNDQLSEKADLEQFLRCRRFLCSRIVTHKCFPICFCSQIKLGKHETDYFMNSKIRAENDPKKLFK